MNKFSNKYIVITSIQSKTDAVKEFERISGWKVIIVGDTSTPEILSNEKCEYLSLQSQLQLNFRYPQLCPLNHYARKNIGYLYSFWRGADMIYDTDDDNYPKANWRIPEFTSSQTLSSPGKFINCFSAYTKEKIWPRGYPLDDIHLNNEFMIQHEPKEVGVVQGMVDNDPDVDAIYRLIIDKKVQLKNTPPFLINNEKYSPFNSQNTFWRNNAFICMYLPGSVNSRFSDILRGYVCQRLLREMNLHLCFTPPNVIQYRNEHNLMNDFKAEIQLYCDVKKVVKVLDNLTLTNDPANNLRAIYKGLSNAGITKQEEVKLVEAWIEDYSRVIKKEG